MTSSIGETVARNVTAARIALRMSQGDLAKAAGVSRATINMIENGACDPRVSTIASVARALSTSPLMLMMQQPELARLGDAQAKPRKIALSPQSSAKMEELRGSKLPRNQVRAIEMARDGAQGAGLAAGGVAGGAIGAMLGGP